MDFSSMSMEELMGVATGRLASSTQMKHYYARIHARVARLQAQTAPDPAELEEAIALEKDWDCLRRYLDFSHLGEGEVFSGLRQIAENPGAFERIGAVKALAMAEESKDFYEEYAALDGDGEAQGDFFWATQERQEATMEIGEGPEEFAALMRTYAEAHEDLFGTQEDRQGADAQSTRDLRIMAAAAGSSREMPAIQDFLKTIASATGQSVPASPPPSTALSEERRQLMERMIDMMSESTGADLRADPGFQEELSKVIEKESGGYGGKFTREER